ncbi:MAG: methyltransferase domain-containing protein [Methanomassiliicoccales archaeon]|nr:methyltransferase domain-containing protein [Methanomassiliicoccales archaeon]
MNNGPKLILDHVSDQDQYSDGDVEEDILTLVRSGNDLEDAIRHDQRWAVLYHLDQRRKNLLEWYPFSKEASLLEIGAGCGALTGLFCEKVRSVTAVEISPRRASIIAARHSTMQNLTVYAGKFDNIGGLKGFDYVTLIGVLEYAGIYQRSPQPYQEMLKHAISALKDNGTLILAIENKLGLKYWAGTPEDHSGVLFQGLEGYPGEEGFRTFGREEIRNMLVETGFSDLEFYYPYPDYKLPECIYSDRLLPSIGDMGKMSPNYDQERFALFDEGLTCDSLLMNGAYSLMANSFLVFCRR